MRLILDTIIALMLAAILVGVVWHQRADATMQHVRDLTRSETRRFRQQIALQSALAQVHRNDRGYPEVIDPIWFQGNLPVNKLLDVAHPWLEVASPDEKDLAHPRQRIAADRRLARFWYNPSTGALRARVPNGLPDADALQLYNFVNESDLPGLFFEERPKTQ